MFKKITPTDRSKSLMGSLETTADAVECLIENVCPPRRERSLAITKLEECFMWANKSIVMHQGEEVNDNGK